MENKSNARFQLRVCTNEFYYNDDYARKRYKDLLKRLQSGNSIICSMSLVDLESGEVIYEY